MNQVVSALEFTTNYPDNNYTIYVGGNILDMKLSEITSGYPSVFYLVDKTVYELHREGLLKAIEQPFILPSGESAKEFDIYISAMEALLEAGVKRNSLIVAIGGGAAGDVAGFIAATILRGVDYVQVPTTILAHDSAVGGKTAINSKHGKNLIGSFHRPVGVIMETGFFETLPYEEVLSGYGEIFKHALLNDKSYVSIILARFRDSVDISQLDDMIAMGIETKLHYVVMDEHESGARRSLNLGHTLAHAVERVHKIRHGHAVIIGLLFMMHLSNLHVSADFNLASYLRHFKQIGTDFSMMNRTKFEDVRAYLLKDKKNTDDDMISFVLMKEIGAPTVMPINIKDVEANFNTFLDTLYKDA